MTEWFAPGRIELLGKHTDYAGGRSLLMALEWGVTVRVHGAESGIRARTTAAPGEVDLSRSADVLENGHWGNYLKVTVSRLGRNFGALAPCTIDISSTLPLASGMSSSSSLVVATALALVRFNGFDRAETWTKEIRSSESLASYLASIENGATFGDLVGDDGVGTFGGSEDHTAMACCRADHLSQFRFGPIVREADAAVPEDLVFVCATSGILAEKTGAARVRYNRASLAACEIVDWWNSETGRTDTTIGQAIQSGDEASDRLTRLIEPDALLAARLRHFLRESEVLVPAATRAFAASDLTGLGEICEESQAVASAWLGNQTPETNRLAALARESGAHAASAFGAGFGGSAWALVDRAGADSFADTWLSRYRAEFPAHVAMSSVLVSRPAGPTRELTDSTDGLGDQMGERAQSAARMA